MTAPRVLIGCEESGVFRRAFLARGFDAWSCDLLPARDGSNRHITGDVRDVLGDGWDLLVVCHPPCTRLCNSGVRWLHTPPPGRTRADMWAELDRVKAQRDATQAEVERLRKGPGRRGIYVASKAKYGNEWTGLRSLGLPIISTWIDECDDGETKDWPDLWSRCVLEASTCGALAVICRPGDVLKGAIVYLTNPTLER